MRAKRRCMHGKRMKRSPIKNEGGSTWVKDVTKWGTKVAKASPRLMGYLGRGAKALSLPGMMLGSASAGEGSTVVDPTTGINKYTGERSNSLF